MEHFRMRKYRGDDTWARVREAYLAGEPAASVARRFDVSVANLRKRASQEGWTRRAEAERLDRHLEPAPPARPATPIPLPLALAPPDPAPPPARPGEFVDAVGDRIDLASGVVTVAAERLPPSQALERALRDAACKLAAGRAAEATALMRAAETLAGLTGAALPTLAQLDDADAGWDATDTAMRVIQRRAADLAGLLLSAADLPDPVHWHAHYLWRADRLGPEVAASDHARAVESGDAERLALWDADGRLKPLHLASEEALWAVSGMVAMSRWFDGHGTVRGFWGEAGEGLGVRD
jgi:hypothetical protein